MHGYDLHRRLRGRTGLGLIWTVKQAQLYGILARFQSRGLIRATVVAQEVRPARRVFRLTKEGRRVYRAWVTEPAERKDFRLVFLAKLYLARQEGSASGLISAQRQRCEAWVRDMTEREKATASNSLDRFVYRYRVGQLEAMLAWLDECAALAEGDASVARRVPR